MLIEVNFHSSIVKFIPPLLIVLLQVITLALGLDSDETVSSALEMAQIEGRVFPPENDYSNEWLASTFVIAFGGEKTTYGFVRQDGTFTIPNLTSGSYVVEVSNPAHVYEPLRVDINSKGKLRARKVNLVLPSQVVQQPYPLKMKPVGLYRYFLQREQWRIMDMLMSPMVVMMVLPVVLVLILPKMMNDPETRKEMEQFSMPKYDMPELSEVMTSFFAGGDKSKSRAIKSKKK